MTIGNKIGISAVIFGTLLGYVFFTIQTIGQLLLNPFDAISSGFSLNQITRTIEINLLEIIDGPDIPKPVESIDGNYIM